MQSKTNQKIYSQDGALTNNNNLENVNVNIIPLSIFFDYETILAMWKYFRLNNNISLQKYPNVSHITFNKRDQAKYNQNFSKYSELGPIFLDFINTNKGSFVYVDMYYTVIIRKSSNYFRVYNSINSGTNTLFSFQRVFSISSDSFILIIK